MVAPRQVWLKVALCATASWLVAVAGCTTLLGIDKEYVEGASNSTTGGNGGAAAGTGGNGGTAGNGGSGGSAGSGGSGPVICPSGAPGPSMISLGRFCMDATEVSNAHYQAFVAANPASNVSGCNNNDIIPGDAWPPLPGDEMLPVVHVDWCDAARFCVWAGKSLCGAHGGGQTPYAQFDSVADSRWYTACTQNDNSDYPYGAYQSARCVDDAFDGVPGFDIASDGAQAVGSVAACRGSSAPYDQLFDLSGNVGEWEDACQGNSCRLRGDSFKDAAGGVACAADDSVPKTTQADDIGFRCCSSGP